MTVVKILVDSGASLLKAKGDGMSVLHVAASSNDIHMLDYSIREIQRQTRDNNINLVNTINSNNFIDM
jgi:hypothetical protein